jgi:hypothetical protein
MISEQRATVSTAGVVAAASNTTMGTNVTVGTVSTWYTLRSLVVPDEDHEVLLVQGMVQRPAVDLMLNGLMRIVVTNGGTYPSSDGVSVYSARDSEGYAKSSALVTIPYNVKNGTVNLQFYTVYVGTYNGQLWCWGHSQHTHA